MIAKFGNVPMLRFSLIFSMSFSTKFDIEKRMFFYYCNLWWVRPKNGVE